VGHLEITVLLVVAVGAFAWVVVRAFRGYGARGESSVRADTMAGGAGLAAEQLDKVRNFDR
jgi:hypothetical protein